MRIAFIIINPQSLNQELRLGQSFEPVDIAAQGRGIADDVRALGARSDFAAAGAAASATSSANATRGFLAICSN